ncbi:flagellar biosynthetic protein FliR [Neobacillus novalis]|uniref:Flagellar biosynthetic protein FliR n=2 Tax=Neobacillus novalis TaxID=220687 RepID=A0AA95MS45_9BACI|nr:flagellar biosynthetic protein FliR [Neobacillus novalis]WHY88412.1 flagellar biosynthetic protein FliR [Neobacillus novalis]
MMPNLDYIPLFLLVFVRLTSFFVSAPLWMERQIPAPFKWGSAFFISILVVGLMEVPQGLELNSNYLLLIMKEVIVGLSMGFFAAILFYAVELAGSFIDLQSGFAMASMFNPQSSIQEPITGRFYYILTIVFFLSINGHHILIQGVMASFQWIPIDSWLPSDASSNLVILALDSIKNMFWLAFLIAAPMLGSIFLVDIALGILAKTAPQMNLFVIGIPVKMMMHYIVIYITLPAFFYVLGRLVNVMVQSFEHILQILGS